MEKMRIIVLSMMMLMMVSLTNGQTVSEFLKEPEGELKVVFMSVYKIKTINRETGYVNGLGQKEVEKGTYHKVDKSLKDDNALLLEEWYKLVKSRLKSMGVAAPDSYEYIDMTNPVASAQESAEKLAGANQWIIITCNDLSKAQKAHKKGSLTLESFKAAMSAQNKKGANFVGRGKNLAVILDKLEEEIK